MRKNLGLLLPILFLVAGASCAVDTDISNESQSIIGGTVVAPDAFPTMGGVLTNAGSVCTGTLISPTAVLTAAHCVEPRLLKLAIQQQGGTPPDVITYQFTFAHDLRAATDGEKIDATAEWNGEFLTNVSGTDPLGIGQWDDIAVLHLATPQTGHAIQQLATTDVVAALDMDAMYRVAGYGMTDDEDQASAGNLTEGESGLDQIGDHELEAGNGDPQQACHGDSGGPIFADDSDTLQIGIASRLANADIGGGQPRCNTGLLYTRIDMYQAWLTEHVSDLGQGGDSDDGMDDDDGMDGGDDMTDDGSDDDGGGCSVGGESSGAAAGALGLFLFAIVFGLRRRRGR